MLSPIPNFSLNPMEEPLTEELVKRESTSQSPPSKRAKLSYTTGEYSLIIALSQGTLSKYADLSVLGSLSLVNKEFRNLIKELNWDFIAKRLWIPKEPTFASINAYMQGWMKHLWSKSTSFREESSAPQSLTIDRYEEMQKADDLLELSEIFGNFDLSKERPATYQGIIQIAKNLSNWCKSIKEELSNKEELSICKTLLQYLPPEIGLLTGLRQLWITDTQLKHLPQEFSQLTGLRELGLSRNRYLVPTLIFQLTNLESLQFIDSNLKKLPPEISQLRNLKCLDLSRNKLKVFPPEIIQLTGLEGLSLCENKIKVLPPQISLLTNLIGLFLDVNKLETLPQEIVQLTGLRVLYLRRNNLDGDAQQLIQVLQQILQIQVVI